MTADKRVNLGHDLREAKRKLLELDGETSFIVSKDRAHEPPTSARYVTPILRNSDA